MLIVGLLVGGLILICLIAFAYAKFSQTKDEEIDDEQTKNGLRGANARRAQGTGQKTSLENGLIPLNYNILLTRASEEETLRHDRKKGSAYDNHNLPHNPNNIYSTVAANL